MATEFRYFTNSPVTPIANAIFNDKTVGYKEVGLYTQLVYLGFIHEVGEWDFSAMGMTALHTDGRVAVRSGLENLETHGYLLRASGMAGARPEGEQVWVAFDEPNVDNWLEVAEQLAAEGYEPLGMTPSFHAWPVVEGVDAKASGKSSGRKFFSEAQNLHRDFLPDAQNLHREFSPDVENLHREFSPVSQNMHRDFLPDAQNLHREDFRGPQVVKPQVNGESGESETGKISRCTKPETGEVSRCMFPAAGNRTQIYVCMDGEDTYKNPSIHTSDRFIGETVENSIVENFPVENRTPSFADDEIAAVMARPDFDQAVVRMRSASKNRNRIKAAPLALAELVLQGLDPTEVADAWDEHVAALKAAHRESGMWTQLTKWLETEAADAVRDRRYRSSSANNADKVRLWAEKTDGANRSVELPEIEEFDPATYGSVLAKPSDAAGLGEGLLATGA